MTGRAVVMAALLAVAACSSAPATPQAGCEAAAEQDPAVRDDLAKASGNLNWEYQNQAKVQADRRDAVTRCLQSRGFVRRGAVERQREQ